MLVGQNTQTDLLRIAAPTVSAAAEVCFDLDEISSSSCDVGAFEEWHFTSLERVSKEDV